MKGSYRITVSNAKVRYDFTIRRNITIIKGDSATGKTTLVELFSRCRKLIYDSRVIGCYGEMGRKPHFVIFGSIN